LAAAAERLPDPQQQRTELQGIALARLAVAAGEPALPALLARLTS
jgi:hypothetical protein